MAQRTRYNASGGAYLEDVPDDVGQQGQQQNQMQDYQTQQAMGGLQSYQPQTFGGGGVTPGGVGGAMYGGMPGLPPGGYLSGQGLGTPMSAQGGAQPGGGLSQAAYEAQQQESLQARLNQEAFDKRFAAFKGIGGAGPFDRIQHDSSGNEALARANAFAQAKEKAGLNAAAALKSLQATMSASGRTGSSQEADRAYGILGGGRSDVNSFINKQLESDLMRAAQVSDLTYQGGITQRGQDMSQSNPIFGLLTAGRLY